MNWKQTRSDGLGRNESMTDAPEIFVIYTQFNPPVSNKMNTGLTKETTLYEILLQGMAHHTRRACCMQKNQIGRQPISAYYPTGGIKKVMPNQEPNA